MLRKDFVVDEYQLYQSRLMGADCVLLICSILDQEKLAAYLKIAHSLGLAALVETHDEEEIDLAIDCGARMIGVNNRNLKGFSVDVGNAASLRAGLRPGIKAVGVFVDQPQEYICQAAEQICLDVIQLHGREDGAYIRSLKEKTSLPVWKAFKIRSKDDLAKALISLCR